MLNRKGQTLVEYVESNTIGKGYCKGDEDKLFE